MKTRYIIILVGIDGAGKTTQSKLLKSFLENILKIQVDVIHFEPPIWLTILQSYFVKHIRNRRLGYHTYRRDHDGYSDKDNFFKKILYVLFYLFVGILFYVRLLMLFLLRFTRDENRIIICDRYPLIDGLTYITFNTQNIPLSVKLTSIWLVFELILQKISIPQCLLLLINPELALRRRVEHSLKRQKIHQLLINYFCNIYLKHRFMKIDTSDKTITTVHREIITKVLRRLETQYQK